MGQFDVIDGFSVLSYPEIEPVDVAEHFGCGKPFCQCDERKEGRVGKLGQVKGVRGRVW